MSWVHLLKGVLIRYKALQFETTDYGCWICRYFLFVLCPPMDYLQIINSLETNNICRCDILQRLQLKIVFISSWTLNSFVYVFNYFQLFWNEKNKCQKPLMIIQEQKHVCNSFCIYPFGFEHANCFYFLLLLLFNFFFALFILKQVTWLFTLLAMFCDWDWNSGSFFLKFTNYHHIFQIFEMLNEYNQLHQFLLMKSSKRAQHHENLWHWHDVETPKKQVVRKYTRRKPAKPINFNNKAVKDFYAHWKCAWFSSSNLFCINVQHVHFFMCSNWPI